MCEANEVHEIKDDNKFPMLLHVWNKIWHLSHIFEHSEFTLFFTKHRSIATAPKTLPVTFLPNRVLCMLESLLILHLWNNQYTTVLHTMNTNSSVFFDSTSTIRRQLLDTVPWISKTTVTTSKSKCSLKSTSQSYIKGGIIRSIHV